MSRRGFALFAGLVFTLVLVCVVLARVGTTRAVEVVPNVPVAQASEAVGENILAEPVPVGAVAEFVSINGGLGAVWEKRVGDGYIAGKEALKDLFVSFRETSPDGSYWDRSVKLGDRGVVKEYEDRLDNVGAWKPDGITDLMIVVEYREWSSEELFVLGVIDEFLSDVDQDDLVVEGITGDCVPDYYTVNGTRVFGPYGRTYKVPPEGAILEAGFSPTSFCNFGEARKLVRWKVLSWPGEVVLEKENKQLKDFITVRDFCWMLESQRPQWQTQRVEIPEGVSRICRDLHGRTETTAEAVLARAGFMSMSGFYVANPVDWEVFVWWSKERPFDENSLPAHKWVPVEKITLSGGEQYGLSLSEGGDLVVNLNADFFDDGDLINAALVQPFVFYPKSEADSFSWQEAEVYRVVLSASGSLVPEKIIWQ